MFQRYLYLFALINLCQSENYLSYKYKVLDDALEDTTKFFEKLKVDYASASWSSNIKREIDEDVSQYIRNTSKRVLQRKKRQKSNVDHIKGIDVLKGFQKDIKLPLMAEDVTFFPIINGLEILWFAASVNSTGVSLFHLHANDLIHMGWYSLDRGVGIIVDNYSFGTLLIVKKLNGGLTILKLTGRGKNYFLSFAQNLEPPDINHVRTWHGMNQLYLGIAGQNYISIYIWLGEHFDLIQVLNFGATKLSSFESRGFMHVVAAGSRTILLRHCLRTNKFTIIQKLPASMDVAVFHVDGNRFAENFLCLSTEKSTILYKQLHDRFVPFQQLPLAKKTVPLVIQKTILLLSLHKDNVTAHQYDGWRFIRLNLELSGIDEIRLTSLYNNNHLLMTRDKLNEWSVARPVWMRRNSWQTLQNEWQSWCLRAKTKSNRRTPRTITNFNGSLRILKGHIGQLKVHNVNGEGVEKLEDLTMRHERIVTRLKEERSLANSTNPMEGHEFSNFRAKKVRVKCVSRCEINRVLAETKDEYLPELRKLKDTQRSLRFEKVRVNFMDNFACPVPAFLLDNVIVNGTINGMQLTDLQDNALKISGDQEITAEHTFANLKVASASIPLDIAVNRTRQEVSAEVIKVKHLNFTEGGILLPLNGPGTTISGTITARKVKFRGLIDLKGRLRGKAVQNPMRAIYGVLELNETYDLGHVKTLNVLSAKDILHPTGKSLKNILINSVLLDADVPVHLNFPKDNAKWNNVILKSHPNWVTARSDRSVFIFGRKHVSRNVSLTPTTRANLPLPILEAQLCSKIAVLPEIKSSTVTFDRLVTKNLKSLNSFGARKLSDVIFDAATSFESINLSGKHLTGSVAVKNASIALINGIDFTGLNSILDKWKQPNVFEGFIRVSNMAVVDLHVPGFELPIPRMVQNVTVKDMYIETINDINVINFAQNVINIEGMVALANIRFDGGLKSRNINAVNSSVPSTKIGDNLRFNSTIITGGLKAKNLILPYKFTYPSPDDASNFIIDGSVSMKNEPLVEHVNRINLRKKANDAWMKNDSPTLSTSHINLKNITLRERPILTHINTPNFGPWLNISQILLSKSKSQDIRVPAFFRSIRAPKILGKKTSTMRTSVSHLDDMFKFSLLKNTTQTVNTTWHFQELKISGNLALKGTINEMNLFTDVVRHDVQENIVTGKKTILDLSTYNLGGLAFDKWAENVLMSQDNNDKRTKPIIIKGHKTFDFVNVQNLSVEGTVMGRNTNDALLKSTNQNISGPKTIRGNVKMASVSTDSLINDVNLTDLMNYQLKKNKSVQSIRNRVIFDGNLVVLGNLKVDGLCQGVQLKDLRKQDEMMQPVVDRTNEIAKIAEGIDVALQNRAVYIHKLQSIDNNMTQFPSCVNNQESFTFDHLGQYQVKDTSVYCNGQRLLYLNLRNSSDLVMFKMISFRNVPFVVYATSTSVSMYSINDTEKKFYQVTDLYVQNVIEASAEATEDSLWIVLRVPRQMLILRYQLWSELQQYVLPESSPFVLSKAPNNQLLLTRFDGLWSLEGVTRPRHVLKTGLAGPIEACSIGADYYIKPENNSTELFKARYVGKR